MLYSRSNMFSVFQWMLVGALQLPNNSVIVARSETPLRVIFEYRMQLTTGLILNLIGPVANKWDFDVIA